MNLCELADLLDVDIEIRRYANQKGRWTCNLERCETKETKESNLLYGTHGNGISVTDAIQDYATTISGRILVFDAYTDRRREFRCPQLQPL